MTNDSSALCRRATIGLLLLAAACDYEVNGDEYDAAMHAEDAAVQRVEDAALQPAQGIEDASSPSVADSATEAAGTESSVSQPSGAIPACSARTLSSFEAGKEQAKCAVYPGEFAQGGDLKLYCSCDLAECPIVAEAPADGAPDKACATMVVGKHCAEALQSTCGLKPGDNDFCAENHGTGRDLCTKREQRSYECTCEGSKEKQTAEHEFCLDALRVACRRGG